jgi:LacI family transcriptional regulator
MADTLASNDDHRPVGVCKRFPTVPSERSKPASDIGISAASGPASGAPTVKDVARAAGVSTATVSRALNQPDSVTPALRQQVLEAVRRMGYVAHAGARALSSRRSGTVGVIVPTIDNAIFASGLQAFQRRMAQAGRVTLMAISDYDPAQEEAQVQALLSRGVDALALTGTSQCTSLMTLLGQRGLPWVHTGSYPSAPGTACVGFDNREAIARAAHYLMDLGHRRIGMLAGIARDNERAAARIEGVRQALARHRLELPERWCVQAAYTIQAAREGTRTLLSGASRPTALICGNDVLAFGAMLEAAALGLEVPRELSVVGFDDLDLARHWQPALTTVHVPTEAMWTMAADYLLQALDVADTLPLQRRIEVELVVRGSTCRAPGGRKPPAG